MVAMGFAAVENTLYVIDGGASIGIIRMFTSVPAHATFGIIMGFFLGLQKINNKKIFGIIGLFLAAAFHGLYDFYLMNIKFNYLYGLYWFFLFLICPTMLQSRKGFCCCSASCNWACWLWVTFHL